ncbi:hypothetical protein E4U09_001883 [Claviceps aff. purpurea]|uniref:Uncharacterized protein n=1 Tax=Claviceps aff. purpurea TaxID=1967640 RepID=A0A9P7QII7_9HYPO|nr:hypothetical protein E4U09_001883 [Claviceps aff. purpurea]
MSRTVEAKCNSAVPLKVQTYRDVVETLSRRSLGESFEGWVSTVLSGKQHTVALGAEIPRP